MMKVSTRFSNSESIPNFDISSCNQTQLIALLALPEGEEQNFIQHMANKGTPVEDMTVKSLTSAIKNFNESSATSTQILDTDKQPTPNFKESSDESHTTLITDQQNIQIKSNNFFDTGIQSQLPERKNLSNVENTVLQTEFFPISNTLKTFLSLIPSLLNDNNLHNSIAMCAAEDLPTLEQQISQISGINVKLQNELDLWKQEQSNKTATMNYTQKKRDVIVIDY